MPSPARIALAAALTLACRHALAQPSFTTQPGKQVLQTGQHAGFLAAASNATSYQWYVTPPHGKRTPIAGATAAFLLTPPVTAADNGAIYSITATGPGGATKSAGAPLLIGPNADGSPPDSVWGNIATIPVARNVMTVRFIDRSAGRVPPSQMFWSIGYTNAAGKTVQEAHAFATNPNFDMPKVGGTRIYVFVAPNLASIGTGNTDYFDFLEVNVGQNANGGAYWINMDTTRVDRWGLPVAYRLRCGDGTLVTRGDDYGLFVDQRQVTYLKYQAELGQPWATAAAGQWPYGINQPGASGFGQGGPYASYYTAYINQVWSTDGLTIPKPTNFLNLATQLPDLSAALNRHVASAAGSFNPDGTLADTSFWQKNPPSTFYQSSPANFYAAFWHEHAISHLQYGFPYDDDDSQSSDTGCTTPKTLTIIVGY